MMGDQERIHGTTQSARAVQTLREMIASGQLEADGRYTEVQLADMLSMSRTPIRAALQRLTDEGALVLASAGGYTVRQFLPEEIYEAIEIRGTLEGLCVRLLAERGVDSGALSCLVEIADGIETALLDEEFTAASIATYSRLNEQFHRTLVDACGSPLLEQELARASARPFASASSLVGMHEPGKTALLHLWTGQDQHRAMIEAISARQGARAEQIMREHARLSQRNLARAVASRRPLGGLPGANLIRQTLEA